MKHKFNARAIVFDLDVDSVKESLEDDWIATAISELAAKSADSQRE